MSTQPRRRNGEFSASRNTPPDAELTTPFQPRPRRERVADKATAEKVALLRDLLERIGDVNVSDFSDPNSDQVLRIESLLIRTAALVDKLDDQQRGKLDPADLKGLTGARNVAAHGYSQLEPGITAQIIHHHLPALLDAIEHASADSPAPFD